MLRKVAVVGAGKIGSTVVDLLVGSGSYSAVLIDQAAEALDPFAGREHVETAALAIEDPRQLGPPSSPTPRPRRWPPRR